MAYYDSIKLEKGMYSIGGKTFTQVLEEMDPSGQYENTDLAGLDAYERQLKRFDIKVGGENSDVMERFFQSGGQCCFVSGICSPGQSAKHGESKPDSQCDAYLTKVDAMDYRTIAASVSQETQKPVTEGSLLPQTTISNQKNLGVSEKTRPASGVLFTKPCGSSWICSR